MSNAVTTFSVQLQTNIKALQNRLEALNTMGAASAQHAAREIRSQIAAVQDRAHAAKGMLEAARAEVGKWADDPSATVSGWKARFDADRLGERADRAMRYAEAASQIAVASGEQAEKAVLDAKLARTEADAAKVAKVTGARL